MRVLLSAALFCGFACAAVGQDANAGKVTVPILIQDSHHRPAINITREDLQIRRRKLVVTDFEIAPTTNLPLRLGILIDVSNSERENGVQYLFKVARDFARDMLRGTDDRVFFGAFNIELRTTPWLDRTGIEQVPPQLGAGQGTALYDAISGACKQMGDLDPNHPTRRVLVIISDGEDNESNVTLVRAAADAVRSRTLIFTLSTVPAAVGGVRGEKAMEDLSKRTGGETISGIVREAPKAFARVSELVRGLYYLTYVSIAESKSGDLEVKSATKEKLHFSFPETLH